MNRECCNCNNIIKISGYNVTSTDFNMTTSFTDSNLKNGEFFKLILCAKIPSITSILPVNIVIAGKNYPVLDRLGNHLMSDQLRTRRAYLIAFGTNPEHFITVNCTNPSVFYA